MFRATEFQSVDGVFNSSRRLPSFNLMHRAEELSPTGQVEVEPRFRIICSGIYCRMIYSFIGYSHGEAVARLRAVILITEVIDV